MLGILEYVFDGSFKIDVPHNALSSGSKIKTFNATLTFATPTLLTRLGKQMEPCKHFKSPFNTMTSLCDIHETCLLLSFY